MNNEDLKLFQLTCGLGCFYVIAHTFDEAAKLLKWRLDKADYGYSSAREVSTITCMAVEHFYTNLQFFSGDNSNLIILNENDFVEDVKETEGAHESQPVCIDNMEQDGCCSVHGVIVPQAETFDEIDDTDDGQPVDLGLPSGTKWMKSNIGATKPSDFGNFFQWGDTQGYEGVDDHQFNWSDYKWGTSWDNITKYNNRDGLTTLQDEDDSAVAATSGQASMPTKAQLEELKNNTEHRWLSLANGVNGMKFWKKDTEEPTDGNSYIFIPAAGNCYDGSHDDVGSWGCVWSASRDESLANSAWYMYFDAGGVYMNDDYRCCGYSVRGVVVPQAKIFDEIDDTDDGQPVDLGLPSGTKWMKSNIGATKPSDFGKFFQWGDTQGYEDASEHQFDWSDYKYGTSWDNITKYNDTDQLMLLESSDDSAVAATGGQASMPTKAQLEELKNNTEHRWLRLANGVNGMKFWKKGTEEPTDGNSYIFIPAAGDCYCGSRSGVGSWGYVWSASRNESGAYGAWLMDFDAGGVSMGYSLRCYGYSVRGVVVPPAETFDEIDDTDDGQPVDLGLPSGTKWMKSNIGATKPSDFGKFFQWGDTQGYSGVDEHQFDWSDYKYGTSWDNITKYNDTDQLTVLESSDDSAVAATGGQASMPTKAQLEELVNNTEHRWLRLANGVNGIKFWKKGIEEPTEGDSYIFIPAAGDCYAGSHDGVGSWGSVWSASRNGSNASHAWYMYFDVGDVSISIYCRCFSCSVRAVVAKNI